MCVQYSLVSKTWYGSQCVRTDVDASGCTRGLYRHSKSALTEATGNQAQVSIVPGFPIRHSTSYPAPCLANVSTVG